MIGRLFAHPRLRFAGVLVIALATLALGVVQALASPGTATVPFQKNNNTCGFDIGTSAFGTVTFTRINKTTLRAHVRLTTATASTKYTISLWRGDGSCGQIGRIGHLETDSNGAGEATYTANTFGYKSFFALALPAIGVFGGSLIAKV